MQRRRPFQVACCAVLVGQVAVAQTTVVYEADSSDVVNPERGFYRYSETRSSNHVPLVESELKANRDAQTPFGANARWEVP